MMFLAEVALFLGGAMALAAAALYFDKREDDPARTVLDLTDTDDAKEVLIRVHSAIARQEAIREKQQHAHA